jgi:D-3-phosphoglycerate dehydrogenase / 2-oxoglutarate reductase
MQHAKDPIRVLITGALHDEAMKLFMGHPKLHVTYQPDCSRSELMGLVSSCQILVTRSETDVDQEVIDTAKELKVIARAAVGVGNIDIQYATTKGILVINCPGKNTNSAAELTLGLMLSLLRKIPDAHHKVKTGGWDRHSFTGRELKGKRLGIVGLGHVGHRVAKFAHGFDMEVSAYDPYISPQLFDKHQVKRYDRLEDLAAHCDILSVHVPLNKETKGMVSTSILEKMPRGSWIINAARGGVFNEKDLIPFLKSGHIAGAGIDTFETEPKVLRELVDLPQVVVSPHIGASTDEAQRSIGQTIFDQVIKSVEGGVVDYPVNLPKVGVIQDPKVKAYAVLAEKLGSLAGQISGFNPAQVEILYRGDLASGDHSLIRLSFLKGYASRVVNDYVSFVNVENHIDRLGIKVEDREQPSFETYRSALKVKLKGQDHRELTVGGLVFDDFIPRLSLINDFYFETEPSGAMLLVENDDKPGVIGDLGHFLGFKGVNIATFELSRNRRGGKAMAVIRVDQELSSEDVKQIKNLRNVLQVNTAFL